MDRAKHASPVFREPSGHRDHAGARPHRKSVVNMRRHNLTPKKNTKKSLSLMTLTTIPGAHRVTSVSTKTVAMRFSSRYRDTCPTRHHGAFSMVGRTVRPSGLPVMGYLTGLLTRCCPTSRTAAGDRVLFGGSPVVHVSHLRSAMPCQRKLVRARWIAGGAHV